MRSKTGNEWNEEAEALEEAARRAARVAKTSRKSPPRRAMTSLNIGAQDLNQREPKNHTRLRSRDTERVKQSVLSPIPKRCRLHNVGDKVKDVAANPKEADREVVYKWWESGNEDVVRTNRKTRMYCAHEAVSSY